MPHSDDDTFNNENVGGFLRDIGMDPLEGAKAASTNEKLADLLLPHPKETEKWFGDKPKIKEFLPHFDTIRDVRRRKKELLDLSMVSPDEIELNDSAAALNEKRLLEATSGNPSGDTHVRFDPAASTATLHATLREADATNKLLGVDRMHEISDETQWEAYLNLGYYGLGEALGQNMSKADAQASAYLLWAVSLWRHSKSKTFEVSPALHDLLSRTWTKGVSPDWVRVPFQMIMLKFPDKTLEMLEYGESCHGLCIFVTRTIVEGQHRLVLVIPKDNSSAQFERLDLDVGNIDDAIQDFEARREASDMVDDSTSVGRFFRLVVNTLLYINSGREDPKERPSERAELEKVAAKKKSPKKKAKVLRKLDEAGDYPRFILGEGITISHDMQEAIDDEDAAAREGRQITCRFMVRGHWRNQAHGPKRSLRKLIWVEPFWKGPRNAAELVQRYVVEE